MDYEKETIKNPDRFGLPTESYEIDRKRLENLYSRHKLAEFVKVRERFAMIRVRIPRKGVLNNTRKEKNFPIKDYGSFDAALEEARRYRQKYSSAVMEFRRDYDLKVEKGLVPKRRFSKPDEHGNLGTMTMRDHSFYFSVVGVINNSERVATFPIKNKDLVNIDAIRLIKREAFRFAEMILEEGGSLVK